MKTSQAIEMPQSMLCNCCAFTVLLNLDIIGRGGKTSSSYVCWVNYFVHLDLYSVFKAGGGKKPQEGFLMPQRSWMKLCLALHLSPQQGQCTVYLLAADLRCHWAPSVWMWFEVEKEQEPAWHLWLPQCLFCKLRGPSAFLIYRQHGWILQQAQEYTIIKHPLGCLAHRQRRMSWCCIVSLRKFLPPEQRDEAGLHRRHRQKEGGRQSATEERQV